MAQALAAFDEPGDRAERLVTLRRLVHSMRGSALTLGFAEVGATAQAVEMKVREAMAESHLREDVDIVALRRSFEPLRFALAKIEA
ncbi:MAG: Hpt domain-containing protein, partial [Betaproteobacteria bacterium]